MHKKNFILVIGFKKPQYFHLFPHKKIIAEICRVSSWEAEFQQSLLVHFFFFFFFFWKFSQYCCETSIIQIQQISWTKSPKNHLITEIAIFFWP